MASDYGCRHCSLNKTAPIVMGFIGRLRARFDDLIVTCGTRCAVHNKAIGGSEASGHLPIWGSEKNESVAVDVTLGEWSEARARHLAMECVRLGATGVGYYPNDKHVHADFKTREQVWRKDVGGYHYVF